ncbi:polysaccharide export protein [Rhodobacteraceae bacterium]|nr:polysaccharide export protein [Paracoccaceae bacterium]
MTIKVFRSSRLLLLTAVVFGLSACALPRSGPSKKEIYAGSELQRGNAFVIPVDPRVAQIASAQPALAFSSSFQNAGIIGSDTISPGDTLNLTVWENVDDGLLVQQGANATQLSEVQVDGAGFIFVPYAGRIKAAGNTPDGLRRVITEKLNLQTPDPQVSVSRVPGDGATVSLMGTIGAQGVYAIERPTRTLSSMIARAGGVSIEPEIAKVTVTRSNGARGTVWLSDLYANPRMDIALRSGDTILVEKDSRAYTALGATGQQARVPFEAKELSALEAIATVGGLQSRTADPTGVFVLRNESQDVARRLLGRNDLIGPQRLVYVLNLTEPNGMFEARDFMIHDDDTVYVTEAPYVQWSKVLSAITSPLSSANSINNLAN